MNAQHIGILKIVIIGYWLSVFIIGYLFGDSSLGMKYMFFAVFTLLIHTIETFLFNKVLQEHSDNVLLDKLAMLPFGLLIPIGLKIQAATKKAQ